MSRVNRRDSLRLLQAAADAGVAHFDTARSYGFGEAEIVLGDLLHGRRDRFTVTTKVGILPPRRMAGLSAAKALTRRLLTVLPSLRAQVRRQAGGLVQAGCFDDVSMTASLHASLRALRTDYVDFLLLHEPSAEVLASGQALAFLERVKQEGKVRRFGVAASPEVFAFACQGASATTDVVQFPSSVFAPYRLACVAAECAMFRHSAFGARLGELQADLARDAVAARRWSEALGVDLRESGVLTGLALSWALSETPAGIVLFTSVQQTHVRENVAAVHGGVASGVIGRFEELVREWMRGR